MIGLVVAVIVGLLGWWADHGRRRYADQATTPAAALFAGFNLVSGRAWAAEPLAAHRTKTPVVWWDYELHEQRRRVRNGKTELRWHKVQDRSEALPEMEVVDDTGSALVRIRGARVVPRLSHRETISGHPGRYLERGFIDVPAGSLAGSHDATGLYRETERIVAVGDAVFVTGGCAIDPERGVPVVANRVMISTRTERFHLLAFAVTEVVALVAMVTALTYGLASIVRPDDLADPTAWVPGIGASVAVFALAWLGIAHNRLRLVAQAADRSWSLVDVQLRRRHDLIPALRDTVAAHARHEQVALTETIAARVRMDDAGSDSEARALSDEAEAQTAALRSLLAVAEAYPELTVDESFRRLQHQLADTEDRIAASRQFHNDSVTLLADRRRRFPDLLIAWLIRLDHRDLIGARGFERTVPGIDHSFDGNVTGSAP